MLILWMINRMGFSFLEENFSTTQREIREALKIKPCYFLFSSSSSLISLFSTFIIIVFFPSLPCHNSSSYFGMFLVNTRDGWCEGGRKKKKVITSWSIKKDVLTWNCNQTPKPLKNFSFLLFIFVYSLPLKRYLPFGCCCMLVTMIINPQREKFFSSAGVRWIHWSK